MQEVTYTIDVTDHRGNRTNPADKVYYEAWHVKKGAVLETGHKKYEYTDYAKEGDIRVCHKGKISSKGVIRFFSKKETGDLGDAGAGLPPAPDTGLKLDKKSMAAGLPFKDAPARRWWSEGKQLAGEKQAERRVEVTFDCITGHPDCAGGNPNFVGPPAWRNLTQTVLP